VVDRVVGETALTGPLAASSRLVYVLSFSCLGDLVPIDELRCDLAQRIGREEREKVICQAPAEIGDRLGRQTLVLACGKPLARKLVKRLLLVL
jgi:hypothetical protein